MVTSKKRKIHTAELVPLETIERRIFCVRARKVILDFDLAFLYGVEVKQLKRAVKRNKSRFPDDFMFVLTHTEFKALRCQFGTSSWGGRRYLPFAFTEQGVAMLSSVLNSERAIQANIMIMRAFTKLREMMVLQSDVRRKIELLENKFSDKFAEHDRYFKAVFDAIRKLLAPEQKRRRPIGFHPARGK